MHESYFVEYKAEEEDEVRGVISNGVREMPFCFKLGSNNQNRQLLVILHGHGANKNFAKYKSSEWDILCPLDIYGAEGFGSWWLGEKGDFFVYRLLQELISHIKDKYNLEHLYFWGSSMGGYGAILHGIALDADAVYAHMPQVKLKGTDYTDGINYKYYKDIFSGDSLYCDLVKYIESKASQMGPVFFLSQNTFDYPNYIQQHFLPLITIMDKKKWAYQANFNLKKGHVLYENINQTVLDSFVKKRNEIYNWKNNRDIEEDGSLFLKKLKVSFFSKEDSIIVKLHTSETKYLYACYLYSSRNLLKKYHYQKDNEFKFSSSFLKNEHLNVVVYLMSLKSKARFSRKISVCIDE